MPERMENHMGESVFLDELVKGPVDDLTFHRASVTGAEHKIVVDVFITEQVFQLVNFGFSVHQHFSNRLGKVDPPNTGLGLWFFQNKCCMGACDTRRKLFDYPFIAEIIQRPTSDTLQFLVDENAGIRFLRSAYYDGIQRHCPSQAPKAGYDICGWLHFLFSWFPPSLFAKLRTFRVKKEYGN